MKPIHWKSYLLAAVALYAVLVVALICHGAEPLPVALAAKAPPEAGPTVVTGSGSLVCTGSSCPVPALVKSGTDSPVDPMTLAVAKLVADAGTYSSTAGSLAQAQAALVSAQAAVARLTQATSAAQTAIVADQAAITALIGPTPVVPPPTPPSGHVVEIVEVSGTSCPACNALDPLIKELAAEIKITRVNVDSDPAALALKPAYLPTFVVKVDGTEVVRYPEKAADPQLRWNKALLLDWFQRTQKWADSNPKDWKP